MSLSIVMALPRTSDDRPRAERLGANAGAIAATLRWGAAVWQLVIV
jgi:hypothetical protein